MIMEDRRTFIKATGVASVVGLTGLAGCTAEESGQDTTEDTTEDDSMDTTTEEDGDTTTEEEGMNFLNGEINMNVSPSVAQEQLEAQYQPIKEYLSNQIGLPAEMRLANNYSAVIEALGSGTSDVAETGPFAAALGVNSDKADIILQRKGYGSWTYVSVIVTNQDSDIESLSDLEGKTVAFSDRLSTSGCLFPLYNMKTEGDLNIGDLPEGSGTNADFEAVFAGGHPQAYETLVNGQADAAGMGGFVQGIQDNWDSEVRVLHEHEGLPRAPIVVSPELSDEEKQAVTDSFVDAPDDIYWGADGEEDTDDDLWFNDVREASVDKYQGVIDVANELGVGSDIFEN
jgi:phosphonate transport system substrate-binding protein